MQKYSQPLEAFEEKVIFCFDRSSYKISRRPLVLLDMYVLAQGVKTGIYRVCDELFSRLIFSSEFNFAFYIRDPFCSEAIRYIKERNFPEKEMVPLNCVLHEIDFFIAPFGVAPESIRKIKIIRQVHFVYDLIAIFKPEFFMEEAATEVNEIMISLTRETIIFAISEHTKKDLISYRPEIKEDQITVILLAADERFKESSNEEKQKEVCAKYGIPYDAPYILSLATIEVRKNLETVVRAFRQYIVDNTGTKLNLVLAGMRGWKLEQLQQKIDKYENLDGKIYFTGFVEDEDLPLLYSRAECFIYLSRYEGFGLPPLEAMACGVPVISSDNSSLPEVVGDAALTFDCEDWKGVANAIAKICEDKTIRKELSAKSLDRAKAFSWDRTAEILLDRLIDEIDIAKINWPIWCDRLNFRDHNVIEGGGRLTGAAVKTGTPGRPLITYITIVRNNEKDIRRTIESVQKQKYKHTEHIILDGMSTDRTFDIVQEYGDKLDYYASETDDGLYDALNKVIPLARGDLICILNSDDWLPEDAAKNVADAYTGAVNELILGAASVKVDSRNTITWLPQPVSNISYFHVANCCHNAIYATKGAYEMSGPYDRNFLIAADFKWIMACFEAGVHFNYIQETVVNYSLGGVSSGHKKHILECQLIIKDRFPFLMDTDVALLNYIYYPWGQCLDHETHKKIDVGNVFDKLVLRYGLYDDFMAAIGFDGSVSVDLTKLPVWQSQHGVVQRLKIMLVHFPRFYSLARRIYHLFKSRV